MTDKELKTQDRFDVFSPPPEIPVQERMKEIRLSGPLSDTEIPEGHYYSLDFNVPQGDRAIEKDLGEEITVNILRDAMRLRKWNDMEKRYDYTSTEFHNFQASVVFSTIRTESQRRLLLHFLIPIEILRSRCWEEGERSL